MVDEVGSPQIGGDRFDRDWTKGSIMRNLLSLSWPMVITNTFMMLGPTIDMVWVGKLGSASIAGVGVAGMAVMLLNSMMMGLAQGMRAVISRYVGAVDFEGASHAARQALVICAGFSITMAIIGIFLAESILILLGLEADVVAEGAAYMRILFVGSVAMSFRMLIEGIMQASGDTVNPMKITIGYRFFHIALCPFLIFGWWIFPALGVRGAALTNVISQSLGTAIGFWFLFSGRTRLRLNMKNFQIDPGMILRIVKVGFPALISGIQRNISQFLLMWFIVPFGTLAVAAHTLNQRIEMMLFMPAFAIGMASGGLAGQNMGAGQPERAERGAWLAVGVVEGIMIVCSVVILVAAENIVRLFSVEAGLIEFAATFLRIAVAGYMVLGFVAVLMNTLSGSGDTVPPMVVGMATVCLVTLPLAYILPRVTTLGVYGVRWAMVADLVIPAFVFIGYFRRGRWKSKII